MGRVHSTCFTGKVVRSLCAPSVRVSRRNGFTLISTLPPGLDEEVRIADLSTLPLSTITGCQCGYYGRTTTPPSLDSSRRRLWEWAWRSKCASSGSLYVTYTGPCTGLGWWPRGGKWCQVNGVLTRPRWPSPVAFTEPSTEGQGVVTRRHRVQ